MVDDTLLTEESFQVLKRLPGEWGDELAVVAAIASALHLSPVKVSASISHLRRRRLVERRIGAPGAPLVEIRKIGR
jgi:DNA-binding IscR family transcriptional regulator